MKIQIIKNIKWFVLVLFFGLTAALGSSYGQDSEPDNGNNGSNQTATAQRTYNSGEISAAVVGVVIHEVSNVVTGLEGNKILQNTGDSILYMLFALIIGWSLVKAMIQGQLNQLVEEIIVVFLYMGIVYAFLNAGGIQTIRQFIDSIASAFVGKDMSTLSGALKSTVETGFDAITSIVSMPDLQTQMQGTGGGDGGFTSDMGLLPSIILSLVNITSKIAAGFIVAVSLVTYCANILISFASIAIAVAMAPIMVPFYILPATRFLFDGWLRFFLGASLLKVVGAFFLHFTDKLMLSLLEVAKNLNLPKDTDFMTLLNGNFMLGICCIILSMLSAHLMAMVPGIASGLLSGSSINSGFSGMGKAIGGMGSQSFDPRVYGGGNGRPEKPDNKPKPETPKPTTDSQSRKTQP